MQSLVDTGIPGLASLPIRSGDLTDGAPYVDRAYLRFAPTYSNLYTSGAPIIIPNHLALYTLYDDLMDDHPEYITRSKLGEDALENEIFEYRFTPPGLTSTSITGDIVKKPKILYVTGTHGHEKSSQIAGFAFFKALCEEWEVREPFRDLRWGCDFVVVPALTPSSIDLNTRKNHNEVDINRNFPTGWGEAGSNDPGNINYSGPSAASELETQIAMDLLDNHPDACAYIDHHQSGSWSSQSFMVWVGAGLPKAQTIALPYLHGMTGYVRHEFPSFAAAETEGTPLSRLAVSIPGSAVREWEQSGIPSYLLETPTGFGGNTFDTRRHNAESVRRFLHHVYVTEIQRRTMAALIEG